MLLEQPPPFALIAGGRPSQARPLEEVGTEVFLHVPSPGLLDRFREMQRYMRQMTAIPGMGRKLDRTRGKAAKKAAKKKKNRGR